MKKIFFLFCILSLALEVALAQSPGIRLYGDVCRFQHRQTGEPYVEAYIAVPGTSISYEEEADGLFQAKVNIQVTIERIEDEERQLFFSDIYNLNLRQESRLKDTTLESRRNGNLIHSHAVSLEPGRYLFRAVATDSIAQKLSKDSTFYEFEVEHLSSTDVGFSDIKWVVGEVDPNNGAIRYGSLEKMIPMVSNNTFINEDFIHFYQEVYNTDNLKEEKFLIRSVVYSGDNRLFITETPGIGRVSRKFNVNLQSVDIRLLSSGIYYMQVEIVTQNNRPIETYREVFYVYNSRDNASSPMPLAYNNETEIFSEYTEEELDYYLQTLLYASSSQEQNFIKSLENYEQKKNFLYNFFEKRKPADKKILDLWNGHLAALQYVNQEFKSSFRPGWQTDRGRIFIKYGIPYDVERFPSKPNLLPYEIWRYNRLGSQTNVIFIFYDPDLATNEYALLHSTKYGELNNPRWRTQLTNGIDNDIDFEKTDRSTRFNPDLEIDR